MNDFVLDSLAPDARVALVGDWGAGTAEARRVLEQIAGHNPDVLIHVGDIYYAGTPRECNDYFLDLVNEVFDRKNKPLPVYSLTGNHEMYCGGAGYYQMLPGLNPASEYAGNQRQQASYFALQTTDRAWQFLAMDTSLHDHDPFTVSKDVTWLEPDEEAWHVDKIRRFSAAGGRTILLSHHQLFSAFDGIGDYKSRPTGQRSINPKLAASYTRFRQAGDIAAWFWGHEHNLCIYQPYAGLEKGRCIGHGAVPVFTVDNPYRILDGLNDDRPLLVNDADGNPLQLDTEDAVYAHGFVIIELAGGQRRATVTYYQDTSDKPLWQEQL